MVNKIIRNLKCIIRTLLVYLCYLVFLKVPTTIKNQRFRYILYDAHNMLPNFIVTEGRNGLRYIINTADKVISKEVFVTGSFEQDKFEQVFDYIFEHEILKCENKNTLLDIGANIGTVCISAIKNNYFQNAVAVEPDNCNAKLLRANININGYENFISVVECAASENDNTNLFFEKSSENFGDHRISTVSDDGLYGESSRKKVSVRGTTINNIFDNNNVEIGSFLLWMDIQGYEGHALAGAKDVIKHKPPLIIEFWPYGLLRTNGYSLLKDALSNYLFFVDINSKSWMKRPINELDSLWDSLGISGDFTDLLFFE